MKGSRVQISVSAQRKRRLPNGYLLFFCIWPILNSGTRSLPFQREVWRVCLYQNGGFIPRVQISVSAQRRRRLPNGYLLFFCIWPILNSGTRSLPFQREVWRVCLYQNGGFILRVQISVSAQRRRRLPIGYLLFFCMRPTLNSGPRSLPFQGVVWWVCLYQEGDFPSFLLFKKIW